MPSGLPEGSNHYDMNQIARLLMAGAFVAGFSAPSEAQIYSWRDAAGTLVLSDRPTNPSATTFAVPRSETVRATRPAAGRYLEAFDGLIEEHAAAQGVRPDLVRAVIQVESAFNPHAVSRKGAAGLMQLMSATAADLGVSDRFDARQNIRGGVAYLRQLLDRYGDNEELALAAYNAGPAAVSRYGNRVPPFAETRQYVSRIKDATDLIATPASRPIIYKTIEIIDGRPVPRYSDTKPASDAYAIVGRQ